MLNALLALLLTAPALAGVEPIQGPQSGGAISQSSGTFTGTGYALQVPNGSVYASSVAAGNYFSVAGATMSVSRSGIVSIPSQPYFRLSRASTTQALAQSSSTLIFWDLVAQNQNFFTALSSSIATVPAGAAGGYLCSCTVGYASAVANYVYSIITLNNSTIIPYANASTNNLGINTVTTTAVFTAAEGDRISCQGRDDTATINVGSAGNMGFSCVKVF